MYNPDNFSRDVDNIRELTEEVEGTDIANSKRNKSAFGLNLRTLTSKNSYWKNIVYLRTLSNDIHLGNTYPRLDADGKLFDKDNIPYETDIRNIKNTEQELGYRSIFTKRIKNTTLTTGVDFARVNVDYFRQLNRNDTLFSFTSNDFRPSPTQYYLILQPQFFNADFEDVAYNASGYVDLSFTVLKRLTLNPGLRYDYTGFAEQHTISPRISGSVQLDGKSTINFASGIFYQDPLLSAVANQPTSIKLKSERTVQYILGYKNYFSSDLKLVAEGWYKQFDDLAVQPLTGQNYLNNNGTGDAYGFDINLTKRLSKKYYGQVGYSYMQSKRDDNDGKGEYNYTYSQPHIFSLLASYKPNNKWVFSAKFRYATGRPKDTYIIHNDVFNDPNFIRYSQEITGKNADRLKDFISLDIRADYRIQRKKIAYTAFIDIVDINNQYNESSEFLQPLTGKTYYDGLGIFPSFGFRVEL